jgi:hypothetical protein
MTKSEKKNRKTLDYADVVRDVVCFQLASKTISSSEQTWSADPAAAVYIVVCIEHTARGWKRTVAASRDSKYGNLGAVNGGPRRRQVPALGLGNACGLSSLPQAAARSREHAGSITTNIRIVTMVADDGLPKELYS